MSRLFKLLCTLALVSLIVFSCMDGKLEKQLEHLRQEQLKKKQIAREKAEKEGTEQESKGKQEQKTTEENKDKEQEGKKQTQEAEKEGREKESKEKQEQKTTEENKDKEQEGKKQPKEAEKEGKEEEGKKQTQEAEKEGKEQEEQKRQQEQEEQRRKEEEQRRQQEQEQRDQEEREQKEIVIPENKGQAISVENKNAISVDYLKTSTSISLNVDKPETIVTSNWLKGTYNSTNQLTLDFSENNTGQDREAHIILKYNDRVQVIKFKQHKAPTPEYLHTHTKGNGVKIVLTGDAFLERELAPGGIYDTLAKQFVEDFFSLEPYSSLKEYFDIISIKAVSEHDYLGGNKTAFSTSERNAFDSPRTSLRKYAKRAIASEDLTNITTIILVNAYAELGTAYMDGEGDGGTFSRVYVGSAYERKKFKELVQHEAGGHGFGLLADEYGGYNNYSEAKKEDIKKLIERTGRYKNIDFTNDEKKVRWHIFLDDNRYKNEGLKLTEGAHYAKKGVWRPAASSVMSNLGDTGFNAPSRQAIYMRCMRLAFGDDWKYDHEKFVEFDAKGREQNKLAR